MLGARNGWQGIEFASGNAGNVTLMIASDSNTSGFHNNSYGWQMKWENGAGYIYKNSYGGGTAATILDTSNFTTWAVSNAGNAASATNAKLVDCLSDRTDTTAYQVAWVAPNQGTNPNTGNSSTYAFSCAAVTIKSSNGTLSATNLAASNRIESSGPSGGTYFYDVDDTNYYFDGAETGDSIRVAGDIVAYYSDDRLKTRLGNIENAVDKVKTLNGFYYEPNETAQKLGYKKKVEIGVSAQEVEQIMPELIKQAPIDMQYKTIDYARLTPLLIEAVKEQQQQIDELKRQINLILNK
jgi:hypothetical protein